MAGEKSVKLSILGDNSKAKAALEEIEAGAEELKAEHPELSIGIDQAKAAEQLSVFRQALKEAAQKVEVPVEVERPEGLDDLEARLAALEATRATIKVDADDKDAVLKLAEIDLALDKIRSKTIDPKVSDRGILDAEAKLAALDVEMDRIKAKQSGGGGFLAFIANGLNSAMSKIPVFGEGLSGLSSKLSGVEGDAEGAGEGLASMGASGAVAVPVLGAVAVAIGGILAEATGLVTGLAAAGAGVGAFALLAYPSIEKVFGALGDTRAQLSKLSPAIQESVGWVKGLKDQYDKLADAFQRPALDLLDDGLSIAEQLLPTVAAFAKAITPELEAIGIGLVKAFDSKSFKSFAAYMESVAPAALKAFASGVKGLMPDLLDLFTILSKKDVINTINIAFRVLGATLDTVIFLIRAAMAVWDSQTAAIHGLRVAFDDVRHAAATFGHDFASAFDSVRHALATFGHDFASAFDSARHAVATAGHDIAHVFDTIRSTISTVVNDIGSFIKTHFHEIAAWIMDPIGMTVYTIKTNTHNIAVAFDTMRHDVAAAVGDVRHGVSSAFDDVRHTIASVADWIPHAIATAWDTVRHDTAAVADWIPHAVETAFDNVRHFISSAFDDIRHLVATAWNDVIRAFSSGSSNVESTARSLPSKILGALEGLPGDLYSAGRNIIEGLVHGIESAASAIPGIMKGLAGDVESYFTDPLKIFSPSRVFIQHGQNIVQGLVNGISGSSHLATSAVTRMANQVANAGAVGIHASVAGGAGARLTAEWVGGSGADAEFITWLKKNVRIRGGNPAVLGR